MSRWIRARRLKLLSLPIALVLVGGLLAITHATPARAACANPIVCENQLPGSPPSAWQVSAGEGTTIQGFADPFSVNVGGSINFKITSPAASYKIDIYRMGYYGGDGARFITSLTPNISVSQNQPTCASNGTTGLIDCGNWGISASWSVPADAVSGVYFAHISRTDGTSDENQIPFVVTNNASTSDMVFMTSDETWQAYNEWGQSGPYKGNSFYVGSASQTAHSPLNNGRAVQISYNRPFSVRYNSGTFGQDFFFSNEFPTVQFLEQNGYDVSYVSESDVSKPGAASMLEQHKIFMNVGHSEYWDAGARANVTAARNAGVSLAFFTGNMMWWKTRWANSQFNNEPYRTLITYKESLDSARTDPADPPTWTGEWRDPRFSPPGDGGQPENALTGQLWTVNCCSYADQVPYAYSKLALWRNTAVANLQPGQTYTMPPETLGYEWDSDVDNGFRPAGEIDMSKTCETVSQLLLDYRENIGTGPACNSLTLYRASSGALVFDAGTVQWAWGLNSNHDSDMNPNSPPDPNMQQATVNLFAMMGVQPATLISGLVPGVAPHDTSPPTSTITSPSAGATLANGSTVTISGTATDSGGGVVAGVEVSTDGGSTWHPVTTMSAAATSVTWSYTWSVAGAGPVTIMSRATDDDANTETPGPGVSVTVNCPCGVFSNNYTPSVTSANDSGAYELGMKFQSSVPGWVAGVRFYKGAGNNGTHTGTLWTASGTKLATGTFTNETASGWQSLTFASPVQISANTTYVVSYYDPSGHYADDQDAFDSALNTPPLTGLKAVYTGTGGGNGVFNAGGPGFPTGTFYGSNYGVDVIFDSSQPAGGPPSVTSVSPYPGSSSNATTGAPSVTFSEPVSTAATFTLTDPSGSTVPGSAAFNGADTVDTFTPTNALAPNTTYTATVDGVVDKFGQTMPKYTYTFTTSKAFNAGGQCPCAVWPDVTPSGAVDSGDTGSVELGLKFQVASGGVVSGIRFYKVPGNTGTHTGTLWTASGTKLATGTFTNESTQGWQELDFSSPVAVTAGTTYVASYHTSVGHYAQTGQGLATAVSTGPLTALANGGVYAYGSTTTFPTGTFNASNYWVDVVYTNSTAGPTISTTNPLNGQTSVPTNTGVSFTFGGAVQAGTVQFSLTGPGGVSVPGTLSYNSGANTGTFVPTSALSAGTTYTATVSGAQNSSGTAMSPYSWSFTTAQATPPPGQCPCSIWPDSTQPSVASANDPGSVNLGVKFQANQNGWITGIRFYKGTGNTGTHVGSLWDASGNLLGQVTFTGESTAGWQQANFSSPIPVTAGTTYTASYFAPNGGYAIDSGGLSSAVTYGPLTALANGGVYGYSTASTRPTSTFNASNYWVDVVFTATAP
jgi:hypothetical protein